MDVNKVYHGKMEDVLKGFSNNHFDSIVTDPPYGLSFMGKKWDYDVPTVEQWKEAYRILKPGGFLLAFGGTRTYHRMVVNIEDAGFEIRDQIQWLYGSGFPKSLNVSMAIDKSLGVERIITGTRKVIKGVAFEQTTPYATGRTEIPTTASATAEGKEWEGWGTALKPANEPICVARKPVEGTVAANVLKYGTGGLNIDGCRISTNDALGGGGATTPAADGWDRPYRHNEDVKKQKAIELIDKVAKAENLGRFPANVILDEFMGELLDQQTGVLKSGANSPLETPKKNNVFGKFNKGNINYFEANEGGASRFFYCPKPDNFERNKGLKNFSLQSVPYNAGKKNLKCNTCKGYITNKGADNKCKCDEPDWIEIEPNGAARANHHPTVKPIDLMRYLVRLVTPKGGICLDPFCGSGTTLIAAKMELMNYVGIDLDETHIPLAESRVKSWNPDLYKPQQLFT